MRHALLLLALTALLEAKPAGKDDPMSPFAWGRNLPTYEGKQVRTAVLTLEDPGLAKADAPAAAIRILGGNERGDDGGTILVLLPPGRLQSFAEEFSSKAKGASKGGFGSVAKSKVVQGTFVRIQGEPALLVDLPAASAAQLPKPSELLAAQKGEATSAALQPSKPGWTRKAFLVSQLDQRGKPETTRELQRLVDLENARAARAKEPRTSVRDLTQRARAGETVVIDDPKAKVEWLLAWQ